MDIYIYVVLVCLHMWDVKHVLLTLSLLPLEHGCVLAVVTNNSFG